MNDSAPSKTPRALQIAAASCLILLVAAPLITRAGMVHFRFGLLMMTLAAGVALLLLIASVVLILLRRFTAHRASLGLSAALAAIPVLVVGSVLSSSAGLPMIHDISTDITDPPAFQAALELRGADANPLERDEDVDQQQRMAYADLGPVVTALDPQTAFARARDTALALGWQVHSADEDKGIIEATYTSAWFGFVDDIAIRIRQQEDGCRIDLRSVSRVGVGDLGANANRIRAFAAAFAADQP